MPTPTQLRNLKQIRPGQVLNPRGTNQYSARQRFEEAIERIAAGKYNGRVQACDDAGLECVFCGLQDCEKLTAGIGPIHTACLVQVKAMTCGDALAHIVWRRALQGDPKVLPETLRRLWPLGVEQDAGQDESWATRLEAAQKRAEAHDRSQLRVSEHREHLDR